MHIGSAHRQVPTLQEARHPPLYIHKESNHPPSITSQIPAMVSSRLSEFSSDEGEFSKAKADYQNALKHSGFTEEVSFTKNKNNEKRRNRRRNIIWFNPPYNAAVKENIGKKFLNIVEKHFTPEHKYRKIFNRNTIKLRYSCMPNMESIIIGHNRRMLQKTSSIYNDAELCNCRNKANCPLNNKCMTQAIIYKASVIQPQPNTTRIYYGATEPPFKYRLRNHQQSFRNVARQSDTNLAKYVWSLKEKNLQWDIKWDIAKQCSPYKCGSRRCGLCLTEKLEILKNSDEFMLNSRSEIMNFCRHRRKFKVKAL